MRAVENGNDSLAVLLIDHGADLNQSDDVSHKKIVIVIVTNIMGYIYEFH